LARPAVSLFIFSSSAPPIALAMAAPGSATVLRIEVACWAAWATLLIAWATLSTFLRAWAIWCLRSLGGGGSSGFGGGADATAALASSFAPLSDLAASARPDLSINHSPAPAIVSSTNRLRLALTYWIDFLIQAACAKRERLGCLPDFVEAQQFLAQT